MRCPPEYLRLCAALLLSAVLHTALLIPYPGTGRVSTPEAQTEETALVARLVSPRSGNPPASSATVPQPPRPAAIPAPPVAGSDQPDERRFYSAHELSRAPRPINEVDLDIPEAALVTRSGRFVLTLRIDASGQVVAYEVEAPDLPEEFTTALAETFRTARFAPGEIAGHKVSSILKVEISIEAAPDEGRGSTP